MKTPTELGYRMPAEWEPHAATWLTWPRRDGISFPDRYDEMLPTYGKLIGQLAQSEEVHINVWDEEMEQFARDTLKDLKTSLKRVFFHPFPAHEPWCRDHGPIFVTREFHGNHEKAVVDWNYNAWGDKYPPYELDDRIPVPISKFRGCPLFSPDMVLEGGSIDVNGRGDLLTTESCLLNPNRNPDLSRSEIERYLKDFLGVTCVLWLGDGIAGDDTDGHVDDLSRFVRPNTIVTVIEDDPADENYEPLRENYKRLKKMRDRDGKRFRIVQLPMPGVVEYGGQRLPASYANFYIANRSVIVPTYGHKNDRVAIDRLQKEFPDRRVIGIDSTELIWGLGSFHCLTQQEPA